MSHVVMLMFPNLYETVRFFSHNHVPRIPPTGGFYVSLTVATLHRDLHNVPARITFLLSGLSTIGMHRGTGLSSGSDFPIELIKRNSDERGLQFQRRSGDFK